MVWKEWAIPILKSRSCPPIHLAGPNPRNMIPKSILGTARRLPEETGSYHSYTFDHSFLLIWRTNIGENSKYYLTSTNQSNQANIATN